MLIQQMVTNISLLVTSFRCLITTIFVFSFFEILPQYPLGVSEVLVRSSEAALLRECLAANTEGGLAALLQDMKRSGVQLTSATGARVCREVLRQEGAGAALSVVGTMHAADSLGMLFHSSGRKILVNVLSRAADEDAATAAGAAKWLLPALERASIGAETTLGEERNERSVNWR